MTQPAPIVAHDWQVDSIHADVFVRVVELLPDLFLRLHLTLREGQWGSQLNATYYRASGAVIREGKQHYLRDYEVKRMLADLRALGVVP